MSNPPSEPPRPTTLQYATPGARRHIQARHILAISYAAIAIPIGLLFLTVGIVSAVRAVNENTSYEKRYERGHAKGFLACSALLLASGGWYLRVGLREL